MKQLQSSFKERVHSESQVRVGCLEKETALISWGSSLMRVLYDYSWKGLWRGVTSKHVLGGLLGAHALWWYLLVHISHVLLMSEITTQGYVFYHYSEKMLPLGQANLKRACSLLGKVPTEVISCQGQISPSLDQRSWTSSQFVDLGDWGSEEWIICFTVKSKTFMQYTSRCIFNTGVSSLANQGPP